MKIYLGEGNSMIITLHKKYIKDFRIYDSFNHLTLQKLIVEIGTKYKYEPNLKGNTNRNRGIKKIIKHCYNKYNQVVITGTEIKSLLHSYEKNNKIILKCPWLLDTILKCIIDLSDTLDEKTLNLIIPESKISCVNLLAPNHKTILNANIKQITKKEAELNKRLITDSLKHKMISLNNNLENNFEPKCKLVRS